MTELSSTDREELAARWAQQGLYEHASIASFARFSLQLMATGAPPSLVRGAASAMIDETDHAQVCFMMARRFGGRPLGPGPLDLEGTLDNKISLQEIVFSAVLEGCVGETIAARLAEHALELATDEQVVEALSKIAVDEHRHADLAWDFIAWVVESSEVALKAATAAFNAAIRSAALVPTEYPGAVDTLSRFGQLSEARSRYVHSRALAIDVVPRAQALLARS